MKLTRCVTIARLCMGLALTLGLLGFLSSAHAEAKKQSFREDIPPLESPYAARHFSSAGFIPPGVLAALSRYGGRRAVRMAQSFVPRSRGGIVFCPSVRVTYDRHGAFFALAGRF